MSDAEQLAQLRELFLSAPGSGSTRAIAVVLSLVLVGVVLHLVRRRTLREEYTPIWLAVALSVAVVSVVWSGEMVRLSNPRLLRTPTVPEPSGRYLSGTSASAVSAPLWL